MPTYEIEDQFGRVYEVEGDTPPSDAEIDELIGSLGMQELSAPPPPRTFQDPNADARDRAVNRQAMLSVSGQPEQPVDVVDRTKTALADTAALAGTRLQQGYHRLGEQGNSLMQLGSEPFMTMGPLALTPSGLRLAGQTKEQAQIFREGALGARENATALEPQAQELEETGIPLVGDVAQGAMSLLPAVAAGPLGIAGVVAAAGAQQGASTLSQAQDVYEQRGFETDKDSPIMPNRAFWKAAGPAAIDAAQTAAITFVAGKLFGQGAEGLTVPAKRAAVQGLVKQSVGEYFEEGTQQLISDAVIAKLSYNPDLTFDQALRGALKAAAIGGILGGGVASAQSGLSVHLEREAENAEMDRRIAESADEIALQGTFPQNAQRSVLEPAPLPTTAEEMVRGDRPKAVEMEIEPSPEAKAATVPPEAGEVESKSGIPVIETDSGKLYPGTSHADAMARVNADHAAGKIPSEERLEVLMAFTDDSKHKFWGIDDKVYDRAAMGEKSGLGGSVQSEQLKAAGLLLPVEQFKPATAKPASPSDLTRTGEKAQGGGVKIGDEQVIMQVPSTLANTKTIEGVRWDIFSGSKLKEKRSAVRVIDVDSGEVLQLKQFPNYDAAESYYKSETAKAEKLQQPTPVETAGKKGEGDRVREVPAGAKILKNTAFPERSFAVHKVPDPNPAYFHYEIWDVETGLGLPHPRFKKLKEATAFVENNFNFNPSQIEYNRTKGIFEPNSIKESVRLARENLEKERVNREQAEAQFERDYPRSPEQSDLVAGAAPETGKIAPTEPSLPTPKIEGKSGAETAGAIAAAVPLTPAPATAGLPPKSQRQIITDLAKGLNLPIRFGRLTTSKFAGYFKPVANLIGSKKADNIPIVSHEVGHKLDSTFKLSADTAIAAELDVLGDPATPGSASSWTKSKTKAYKMGEGVAEFTRLWLTDPAKALKDAPNTHRAFVAALDANKDVGDVMRQAQEDIQVWRTSEPQARLRSQITTGNPNKTKYTGSQLIRDLVDDLHILRLASEHGQQTAPLAPSRNPYLLARNLRGSYGMADTFVRHGVADFNTKEVTLGTSLSDALKPVAGKLNDFRDWIVAKRAQELIRQGKETGLVATDVDTVAAKFDSDPEFQKAFADVKAWNDALLQYAVDSGLVTPESAAAMRKMNLDYVPFHRVFEVGAGEVGSQSSGIGMGLNVGKPGSMKSLKGSTRSILDPLETMVQNAYTLITASEKAAISKAVAGMADLPDMGRWVERVAAPKQAVSLTVEKIRKQLDAAGADTTAVPDDLLLTFFRPGTMAPFGENIIRVTRGGKPEFYRLNKDLHDTFKALDLEDTSTLIRILSAPAQLLRSGVVLEPSFNIANVLRDTFSAAVINKYGALPFETTFRGVAAMLTKPQAVAEWAAAGGRNSIESVYFDRDKLKAFLAERISKDLTKAEKALIVAKSPLTALRWLTSQFEEATRIGEYQIAYKKLTESGMPEGEARRQAAFEARDRQDFAKGGAKTKIVRHMAAFWNAQLQANVKLVQAFKQRPLRTTLQGLAFVTIPKLLEQALNWDDDDYWKRPQWERDLFFLIPIGKDETGHTKFLRIPTPFEVGVIFGSFPGRILQWMKTKRPDAMADFPSLMLKSSIPNPTPQSAQVVFETLLSGDQGWSVWRGRQIVPDALADLPADLQWTDQTSRAAKEIGKRIGFSPMKVDHIIESTTGGIGKLATGRAVPGQRFVTAPLRVSNQPTQDFYERLKELRQQAARVKLTGTGTTPPELSAFEATSRKLSELRGEVKKTDDKAAKARLQARMLEIVSELMARQRKKD